MSLASGTKLGPYEVVGPLGAGGMGEVYRARDLRLDRTVAIKILPQQLSTDPVRRQRFEREAKTISNLNHPHICVLHDVGYQDGIEYLVMECVEGQTLAKRLEKGPLPLEQVLKYGTQIADALNKAHRSGIVHRDLKPGNIMLTAAGTKLLDFGLAKPLEVAPAASLTSLPTSSKALEGATRSPLTTEGTVLGTFQYMSPEQLEGKDADARSDIFALGAVLYEMATGNRAFQGKSQISVMSAILEKDPEPISVSQPLTPPGLEHVIARALAKVPDERWQSASDIKGELEWIAAAGSRARPEGQSRLNRTVLALAGACAVLVAALIATVLFLTRPSAPTVEVRASILAPQKTDFMLMEDDGAGPVQISPDGTNIAFVARDEQGRSRIWVRALNGGDARPVGGTDEGTYPFWSPDGKWLGFFANSKLKKVPIETGPVLELADAVRGRGGSWGPDNTILFAPSPTSPIQAVSSAGGAAKTVTAINPAMHTTHRWPLWLPDGKRFLYLATAHGNAAASEHNGIYISSLDGKENRMLLPCESNAALAPGYLLFLQGGTLMAQAFNERRGELTADPVPVAQSVSYNPGTWRAAFDASRNGVLVYQPGSSAQQSELLWQSPTNKVPVKAVDGTDKYGLVQLSPDGRKLATTIGQPRSELWIVDLALGTKTRFTFMGNSEAIVSAAAWAPDGGHIAFSQVSPGESNIYVKEAGGAGQQEKLALRGMVLNTVDDWSKDGKYLLYHAASIAPVTPLSLYVLPMNGDKRTQLFLSASPYTITEGRFSPDGKWLAYLSNETTRFEAYVTSFPDANGKWQISADGADSVRWFPNGQALLYHRTDGRIVKVPFLAHGKGADLGAQQTYVTTRSYRLAAEDTWDVAADGRVIVNSPLGEDTRAIEVVVNWTAASKKK
jgi:eukaryotic-like serine/threonine-protein kinase